MSEVREGVTQKTFTPSPYQVIEWPQVGTSTEDGSVFVSSDFEVIDTGRAMQDPMFTDFSSGQSAAAIAKNSAEKKKKQNVDVAKLEEEIEALKKQAAESFEKGKLQGFEEGKKQTETQVEAKIEGLRNVFQDMKTQLVEHGAQTEQEAVKLSLELVNKILGHAVEVMPEYIGSVVKETLKFVGSSKVVKIKVSPQDMEFINVVGIKNYLTQIDFPLNFEADQTIRSGCVVETTDGEIDGRLHEAFEQIKGKIFKALSA